MNDFLVLAVSPNASSSMPTALFVTVVLCLQILAERIARPVKHNFLSESAQLQGRCRVPDPGLPPGMAAV